MKNCYSLKQLGINAYAFPKKQALNIISELKKKYIPILGGDVYCLDNGVITDSYDNWYCNLETGESQKHFMERSYSVAKKYIENYPENESVESLFCIVTETYGCSEVEERYLKYQTEDIGARYITMDCPSMNHSTNEETEEI